MNKSAIILSFIKEHLLDSPQVKINENTSLFQDRLLDSLNLITLVDFLGKTFSTEVPPSEITSENFDTVKDIVIFISKKLPENINSSSK